MPLLRQQQHVWSRWAALSNSVWARYGPGCLPLICVSPFDAGGLASGLKSAAMLHFSGKSMPLLTNFNPELRGLLPMLRAWELTWACASSLQLRPAVTGQGPGCWTPALQSECNCKSRASSTTKHPRAQQVGLLRNG